MEKLVIEKKFKKLGTKDLEARVQRGNLSIPEIEVAGEILQSRESKMDVEIFILRKKVEKHLDHLQTTNSHSAYEKIEEVLGDCEIKDLTKEELQAILEIKEVKEKTDTPKTTTKRQTLSDEDVEKIKSIVDKSFGSKKELIITLLETGITKQKLEKYRPAIAHWSYVYEIANQLGK